MFHEVPSVDHRNFLPFKVGAATTIRCRLEAPGSKPSAPGSFRAKEAREPAADTCVQAENLAAADIFLMMFLRV